MSLYEVFFYCTSTLNSVNRLMNITKKGVSWDLMPTGSTGIAQTLRELGYTVEDQGNSLYAKLEHYPIPIQRYTIFLKLLIGLCPQRKPHTVPPF